MQVFQLDSRFATGVDRFCSCPLRARRRVPTDRRSVEKVADAKTMAHRAELFRRDLGAEARCSTDKPTIRAERWGRGGMGFTLH